MLSYVAINTSLLSLRTNLYATLIVNQISPLPGTRPAESNTTGLVRATFPALVVYVVSGVVVPAA